MATGLLALFDDVAAIAKVAAASVDDVGGLAMKAGAKSTGVVIDDAAVTPRYVVGFAAKRELPIIWAIAKGSLRNKLLVLLPGALALSLLAPWAITPLLMQSAGCSCASKGPVNWPRRFSTRAATPAARCRHARRPAPARLPSWSGAHRVGRSRPISSCRPRSWRSPCPRCRLRASVHGRRWFWRWSGSGSRQLVYGVVALIVKADDAVVALAARRGRVLPAIGRASWCARCRGCWQLALSAVGTVAMLLVGGDILLVATR